MNAGTDIDDLLDRLRQTPHRLREMVAGREDAELTRAAVDGGWGPVEVFCHLRDAEELFIERVSRMLTDDDPYLPVVDETLWPIEREYSHQNPWVALEQFAENRARFTGILSDLSPDQWQRIGHHEEVGEQTVLWYAQHALEHDLMHEQQLRDLLSDAR